MPIETVIDMEYGIIIHTVIGQIIFEDIAVSFEKVSTHRDFKKDMPVIWDLRKADGSNIDIEIIEKVTQYYGDQSTKRFGYKSAVVVSGDLEFGISRMAEAYSINVPAEIEVFRSYEAAMEWVLKKV